MFEDREFTRQALEHTKIDFYESKTVDSIHAIHNLSSSNCFPQFLIPSFMLPAHSPDAHGHILQLVKVVRAINEARGLVPARPAAAPLPQTS